MGYHSSPALAFLMTLFNVRLGWWLGNPGLAGNDTWQRRNPRSSILPYIYEATGNTNDTYPYVYLSDGGHFENLGLYEMVLRRSHRIVVSDGGCDPKYVYEDLGNAVRKIRIDLGIPDRHHTHGHHLARQRQAREVLRHRHDRLPGRRRTGCRQRDSSSTSSPSYIRMKVRATS